MGSEDSWTRATIAELASAEPYSTQIGPFGNKIKSKIYTLTGAPVLRGTQVNTDSRYHDGDYVFVSEEYAEIELGKFVCEADDIILCHKGTLGKIGIVPRKSSYERYIMGNSMMKVRCNREKVEPLYLYYWLCSHEGQHHIFSNVSQTGVPQIQRPLSTLREARVSLPSMANQKSIAHILGSLDDKIELNREMNGTLESMARALFKSWFVDFDPVIDKALAAGNPIPEPLSARAQTRRALAGQTKPLPDHIQKLFPDAFQFDEEIGWIPEGWQVNALPSVIDFLEGPGIRNWQYTERDDGCKFINIRCIKNGDLSLSTANKITKEEAFGKYSHFQLAEDDIVISTSGTLGRFAFVRSEHLPLSLNTSVIRFRPVHGVSTTHYIAGYCATRLQWELETRASGSVQRNFGPMHLKKIRMLSPALELLEAHSETADPLFRKGQFNLKRMDTLAKLRDTLLPQLLSGTLRVPDAEQLVADSL